MTADAASPRPVGLIGCGAFARLYHVPVLRTDPRVRLVAICEPAPDDETRRLAAGTGAILSADLASLWAALRGDAGRAAVIVSTPHALHVEHARAAIAHRRHLLVDKPFVLRSAEARELTDAVRGAGRVGAVALTRRLDPGSRRARALIQAGHLGAVRHVETVQLGYHAVGWVGDPVLGGGGPFLGRGAHMADLIPWLLGCRPSRVRSRIHPGPAGQIDRGGFIEADLDGCTAQMTVLAAGLPTWDEIRVFGDQGLIELRRGLGQPLGWEMRWTDARGELREQLPATAAVGAATRDFLDALEDGRDPACPFEAAWLSVRVIEAAYESAARDGAWIVL